MKRFVWYSDTHMDMSLLPFIKRLYVLRPVRLGADGVIITGDISSGLMLESDLKFLAKNFSGPIYFILGNHDYYGRHIESVHSDVKRLCDKHSNLLWLTNLEVISLDDKTALVGCEGWYDGKVGDVNSLHFSLDRFVIFDFLNFKNLHEVIQAWQDMALQSSNNVVKKLQKAFQAHDTVYVATHFPPWKEATRDSFRVTQNLWLPYNTNVTLGKAIEDLMKNYPHKKVIVLAGHTHTPCKITVANNIECIVSRASFFGPGAAKPEETIII